MEIKELEAKVLDDVKKIVDHYDETGDFDKGFPFKKLLAETGDAEYQYHLACDYQFGLGVDENNNQAIFWFYKSFDNGYHEAMAGLAMLYELEQNFYDALRCYEIGSRCNVDICTYKVAMYNEKGIATPINYKKAFEYYLQASKTMALANNDVARCYKNGIGVEKDLAKAKEVLALIPKELKGRG